MFEPLPANIFVLSKVLKKTYMFGGRNTSACPTNSL